MLLRFLVRQLHLDVVNYVIAPELTECDKLSLFAAQADVTTRLHVTASARYAYACAVDAHEHLITKNHFRTHATSVAHGAAYGGHVHILKKCLSLPSHDLFEIGKIAVDRCHVDVVRVIMQNMWNPEYNNIIDFAATMGNLAFIKQLHERGVHMERAATIALQAGHVAVWDYLIPYNDNARENAAVYAVRSPDPISTYEHAIAHGAKQTTYAFNYACATGRLDLCKRLYELGCPRDDIAYAWAGTHIPILEWLESVGIIRTHGHDSANPHWRAAKAGCWQASEYLLSRNVPIPPQAYTWTRDLKYLQWLHSIKLPIHEDAILNGLVNNSLDVCEWLLSVGAPLRTEWYSAVDPSMKLWFLTHVQPGESMLQRIMRSGDVDALKLILHKIDKNQALDILAEVSGNVIADDDPCLRERVNECERMCRS